MQIKLRELKKDLKILIFVFIILLFGFGIIFYKENFSHTLKLVSFLFFVCILPGHLIMNFLFEKGDYGEKIVIGSVLMLAIAGIFSYYIGLIFGNIFYYFVLHGLMVLLLVYLNYFYGNKIKK